MLVEDTQDAEMDSLDPSALLAQGEAHLGLEQEAGYCLSSRSWRWDQNAGRDPLSFYHLFPYDSHNLPIIITLSSEEIHKHKPLFYKQVTENSFLRWPSCFRLNQF